MATARPFDPFDPSCPQNQVTLNSKKNFCKPNPLIVPAIGVKGGGIASPALPASLTTTTTDTPPPPRKRCTPSMVQRQFAPVNLAPSKSGAHTIFDCRCTPTAIAPCRPSWLPSSRRPPAIAPHPCQFCRKNQIFPVRAPLNAIFSSKIQHQ